MLHGYELPRAVEIVPGVFVGGEAAALQLVAPRGSGAGGPEPDEFKFFSGEPRSRPLANAHLLILCTHRQ